MQDLRTGGAVVRQNRLILAALADGPILQHTQVVPRRKPGNHLGHNAVVN